MPEAEPIAETVASPEKAIVHEGGRAWRLPTLCAVCRGWGAARICFACFERFGPLRPRCVRCAVEIAPGTSHCGACLAAPPRFDAAAARVDYAFPWDRAVAAFKFRGALDLAGVFADGIVEAVAVSRRAVTDDGHGSRPDLVVPVPLAPQRLRERGCNQAWEVARRVARRLRLVADARLVLRIRETAHQLDLPHAERAGNVRGAFAIEPRRRSELRGRHVAIVDDVLTTGSTAAEIVATLRQAGAARVSVWVFARTPPPGRE